MTCCSKPGNSFGTGWETTSSTGSYTARLLPTHTSGMATAGTLLSLPPGSARRHRRRGHSLARSAHPPRPAPATGTAFLDAAHRAARRSIQGRRGVVAGLLALTVIAVSAAGIAVHDAAGAYREHAISLSRQLAIESLAINPGIP